MNFPSEVPKIELENSIVLDALTTSNTNLIYQMYSNSQVLKYMDEGTHNSVQDSERFILEAQNEFERQKNITWMIEYYGEFAGIITLKNIEHIHLFSQVGYYLIPAFSGKKIASLSLNAVGDYAFKALGIHRLEAQVHIDHIASIKVLENAGFTKEGELRENFLVDGKFCNSYLYSRINEKQN